MANGDTKTNQYLDIAANGSRADLPADSCCDTRTQSLIRDVAERIMDVEDEVERLENNPDVVDIVATYADLQAYDTSTLTDKDIIRVLEDSTHNNNSTYYRWNANTNQFDFVGEISGGGGPVGEPRVLTSADYNANSSNWSDTDPANFNCVALWKLPAGMYQKDDNSVAVKATRFANVTTDRLVIVGKRSSTYRDTPIIVIDAINQSHGGSTLGTFYYVPDDGLVYNGANIRYDLKNNLTTTIDGFALDATQGKVLKDLIDGLVKSGAGAPTTSTVGTVGMLYEDTTNGKLYQCTAVSGSTYTWTEVGASGGGGPTVVQTYGSSTTDVMSQNAVTGLVYEGNTSTRVKLGNSATAWHYSTALGSNSSASYGGSVALGAYSSVSNVGEVNIGTSHTDYGYNNTNYRLLSGVHDGQTAHDAVTVAQVNATIDAINTALSTSIPHIGAST